VRMKRVGLVEQADQETQINDDASRRRSPGRKARVIDGSESDAAMGMAPR